MAMQKMKEAYAAIKKGKSIATDASTKQLFAQKEREIA
jgi:hypothetical protein